VRFVADESCALSVVRALQARGHEVATVSELRPGAPDVEVVELAVALNAVVVTEDKDFGRLAVAGGEASPSVVLIRAPHGGRREMLALLLTWLSTRSTLPRGAIVVAEPARIRMTRRPATI